MIVVVDNTNSEKRVFRKQLIEFIKRQKCDYVIARTYSKIVGICRNTEVSGFILTGSWLDVNAIDKDREEMNIFAISHGAPVMGICFGAQFINCYFGGNLVRIGQARHIKRDVEIKGPVTGIFAGFKSKFKADFYAAYAISDLAPSLRPICIDDENGRVVAFRHRRRKIWGCVFHPESICADTEMIITNFMSKLQIKEERK
jgi:anthranilate/para-aminobenzoate synthase component II